MNTKNIMAFIESERLKAKLHKTKLASKAEISVSYYNKVLEGAYTPSYVILASLLNVLGYSFMIVPTQLKNI